MGVRRRRNFEGLPPSPRPSCSPSFKVTPNVEEGSGERKGTRSRWRATPKCPEQPFPARWQRGPSQMLAAGEGCGDNELLMSH